MISKAKVTSKGQITIPKDVRDALDIKVGDELEFTCANGKAEVGVVKRRSLKEFRGIFPATRPWPGIDAVREEVGRELGRQLANGGHE